MARSKHSKVFHPSHRGEPPPWKHNNFFGENAPAPLPEISKSATDEPLLAK